MELPMDHNPFMTVNTEEGEDIYCQTALATASISSPCQQSTHTAGLYEISYSYVSDVDHFTFRLLPSNQL